LCVTHPNLWPGSNKRCSKGCCAIRKKGGRQYTSIKMTCWFNVREVCVECTCKESPFRELRCLVWSTLWRTLEPLGVAHNKPVLATDYCRVRCLSPLCTSIGSRFRELKAFPHLDFTLRQTFGAPSASRRFTATANSPLETGLLISTSICNFCLLAMVSKVSCELTPHLPAKQLDFKLVSSGCTVWRSLSSCKIWKSWLCFIACRACSTLGENK
jgi:hypothetical protein